MLSFWGLRYVEVLVPQPERLLGTVLCSRLDEVELPRRELQIRSERMEEVARDFLTLVCLALLDEPKCLFGDDDAIGRHLGGLLRPVPGSRRHLAGIASLSEDSEVFDCTGLDDVTGQQKASRQHRPQPVEEHVQAAQRGPKEAGGRHAELGVTGDDGNVCHQRDLEATAECVATDLSHGHLREAHQVVVEAERLAVHREPAALTGTGLRGSGFARRCLSAPRSPYQP